MSSTLNKVTVILILVGLLLPSLVLAEGNSYIFKKNQLIEFNIPIYYDNLDKADNNTNCTLTLRNPTDKIILNNELMTPVGNGIYHYHINASNISMNGFYYSSITCSDTIINGLSTFTFLVTPSGTKPSVAQGILYSILLLILIVLLVFSISGAYNIDGNNEYDVGGKLMRVNLNKYIKIGLFFLSYLFLIFIAFITRAIAANFLFLGFALEVLDFIHLLLWWLLLPIFIAFTISLIIKTVLDMRLQDLAKRNLKPRKGGRRGW